VGGQPKTRNARKGSIYCEDRRGDAARNTFKGGKLLEFVTMMKRE
jgi:hypothetical protein